MDVTKEDVWETPDLITPPLFPDPGASAGTPVSFQVKQDFEVPDRYDSLDAAIVTVGSKPVIAFDIKAGILSVPRWVLHPIEIVHTSAGEKATDAKTFTEVEWGIGEKHIFDAVSALTIIKLLISNKLLLCSASAGLAEALDFPLAVGATNTTGRRLLSQRALDCGTFKSKRFCIVGQPPPNWSAGERAVLVAAHWTPRFAAGSAMLVCAPLGPLFKNVYTTRAASGPASYNHEGQVVGAALIAGVACVIGILVVVLAVCMRMRKGSRSLTVPA